VPQVLGFVRLGLRARPPDPAAWTGLAPFAAGIALVVALLGGLCLSAASRPIRRLAVLSRDIAGGNFDRGVDLRPGGEIGELADALRVMLERLRDYRARVRSHQIDLERQVRERTLELEQRTEEAVELAQRAEAANQAKSQFLANMSHEIRTPVNGVLGMAELLLGTELSARQRRFGETIRSSGRILLGVIDDVLNFSRAEAGRLELAIEPFDLHSAIEDVVELLAERAHGKGLELFCFVDHDVPRQVRSDRLRTQQIVTNLVGNSIKFTETGEVGVRLSRVSPEDEQGTEARAPARCTLLLEVIDTGMGIPESFRERIFKSFSQADGSLARRFGGTGLGLAISKQLAELLGAEIGFDSEEGVGSRFWVRFPVDVVDERSAEEEAGALRGRRVLVAQRHATSQEILVHRLRGWGAQASGVEDAGACLAALREAQQQGEPYHTVLIDTDLSPQNALVREIRAVPELSTLRIALLCRVTETPGPEEAALRVQCRIPKPPRPRDLLIALGEEEGKRAHTAAARVRYRARVLLAEDNAVNREVAVAVLEDLGCEVHAVPDGRDAVARAGSERFDLVLMDCQMPIVDGYAAARAIRAREAHRGAGRLPIVALTAHALPEDRKSSLESGMDEHLSKPFTREQLAAMIERFAGGTRVSLPAAGAGDASPLPVHASAPSESLSSEVLERLRALDRDGTLVARVVDAFCKASLDLETEIRSALDTGDAAAVARAAHALKSSSGNVGAFRVAALARDLEGHARALRAAEMREAAQDLTAELERVREQLGAGAARGR
jgi:signal transduction histidine kinase/DNA-binding response OmpR family regulator